MNTTRILENKKDIFAPRFKGERFASHRMPLELLEDFKVLQEMTVEMAKQIYLEENQSRQRVPKDFGKGINFELESLDEGSTIPKIVMTFMLSGMFPAHNVEYFEKASERIKDTIQEAAVDGNILEYAPKSVLHYFNRFGKKLKDDESIEFRPEDSHYKAVFTKNTRRRLVSASTSTGEYSEDISIRGVLVEMDKINNTFQIITSLGKKISGSFDNEIKDQFLEAFSALEGQQKIILKGTGGFSTNDKLKNIIGVESLAILDKNDLGYRLDELSLLKDGWFNGEGKSLNPEKLKWFSENYENIIALEDIETLAFPTPEGFLQLEWSYENIEASFLIDLQNQSGEFSSISINSSDDEVDFSVDLTQNEGWMQLKTELENLFI